MDHYKIMREQQAMFGMDQREAFRVASDMIRPKSLIKPAEVCTKCKGTGFGPKVYEDEGFYFPNGLVGPCDAC